MNIVEKTKKLETLPWQALHDIAMKKGIDPKEVNGKEKSVIIQLLLSSTVLSDEEIEQLVNDYIYGDRIAFTLWTFQSALQDDDYERIRELESVEEEFLALNGYRKMKILSVKDFNDRMEILYVYSKEYTYIDETGHNANVWEQHRGCLWVGKDATYLACISKHEKMTLFITRFISAWISNTISQIKPPKSAIEKCANFKAVSRIVLQGKDGEKTIVSRAGGITNEQEEEIERIKSERIDTSGSYIASITEDVDATVKYNVRNGSIGIYKHLSAPVLFAWSENAIKVILQEIDELKGKPAEEIYREVGQEIKWNMVSTVEIEQLNWYLTQVISALDKESHEVQIPENKSRVLENLKFFMKIPRLYCKQCDSYETPYCANCGAKIEFDSGKIKPCSCGYPMKLQCSEGHATCEIEYWYLPTQTLLNMIKKNIQKIYKDYILEYNMCIIGTMLSIGNNKGDTSEVEVPFDSIECFKNNIDEIPEHIRAYAVNLNEKCTNGTCSRKKIEECIKSDDMVCLPKVFYSILPGYRPQPHKGGEYGDVAAEVKVNNITYELKGIIKKNSRNLPRKPVEDAEKIQSLLLSTSSEGQEIIRQFVEQGLADTRCQLIAVIVPQYIDAGFKGTLRYLARLSGKKVTFIELDQMCNLISMNEKIRIPQA